MKISALFAKKHSFPWVTWSVTLCCIMVTGISILWPHLYEELAWSNQPTHLWQYVSGAFLHGDQNKQLPLTLAHLIVNLLMFIPYGVMIENLLGHKRFGITFLWSWLGTSAVFQIFVYATVPTGAVAYGAGLSGSSFAIIAMGAFILFRIFLLDKKKFFRQPLAYIFLSGLIGELSFLHPNVAGISSLIIHLSGIAIGIICTVIFRKAIYSSLQTLAERE